MSPNQHIQSFILDLSLIFESSPLNKRGFKISVAEVRFDLRKFSEMKMTEFSKKIQEKHAFLRPTLLYFIDEWVHGRWSSCLISIISAFWFLLFNKRFKQNTESMKPTLLWFSRTRETRRQPKRYTSTMYETKVLKL